VHFSFYYKPYLALVVKKSCHLPTVIGNVIVSISFQLKTTKLPVFGRVRSQSVNAQGAEGLVARKPQRVDDEAAVPVAAVGVEVVDGGVVADRRDQDGSVLVEGAVRDVGRVARQDLAEHVRGVVGRARVVFEGCALAAHCFQDCDVGRG